MPSAPRVWRGMIRSGRARHADEIDRLKITILSLQIGEGIRYRDRTSLFLLTCSILYRYSNYVTAKIAGSTAEYNERERNR